MLPKKYNHIDSEKKWRDHWESEQVYRWDETQGRENTFVIDTPPPTVSGSLHIGHVFSYTQTDIIARYQRMTGKSVFYPMGFDDNGLPTERRVQLVFGISCNPSLPYDPNWKPKKAGKGDAVREVSRENFIEACAVLTQEDERVFEHLWRKLGLSVDWKLSYESINDHCRKISQLSFLDLFEKGYVYQSQTPAMWDVDYKTAVAQAELEDREVKGAFHDIEFAIEGGGSFTISTTRPELLPACIAVVAHPDDTRYQPYFGKMAITPLFQAKVPILPAAHADPEKGTGILMVCTFGDGMDVEFWRESRLPIKQIVGRDGRLLPIDFHVAPFESVAPDHAETYYASLEGLSLRQARKVLAGLLMEPGSSVVSDGAAMAASPRDVMHPVKFYEKGESPIEFISTRQWFIKILEHKAALQEQGQKIEWHPHFMRSRYENWVSGLNQDWCVSRQRFFGVPFPVWYRLNEDREPDYTDPIVARPDQLPVDPMAHAPDGFLESQRNQPGGFTADPDVMDTWATSSLTPQIMSHWGLDQERHAQVFPMDLRPQSHEIIRTWAFYTIAKAWMHEHEIPWKAVAISGWVLDPDRKKMSKSKGNVVTPEHLLDSYSSDAIRYWSAKAKLGADTAYDESVFMIGKKLVTKLFNASKFVMMQIQDADALTQADITEPVDRDYSHHLKEMIADVTTCLDAMEYAHALDRIEGAFWQFCDHYIELVKTRAYKEEDTHKKRSAQATLRESLKVFLLLFAPFLPYVTEEVWSWHFGQTSDTSSIHSVLWPGACFFSEVPEPVSSCLFETAVFLLTQIRGAKTKAQKNMKHPVKKLMISCQVQEEARVALVLEDIYRAGSIETHELSVQDRELACEVILV